LPRKKYFVSLLLKQKTFFNAMTPTTAILRIVFCYFRQTVTTPNAGGRPSEISIKTQVAAKYGGLLLSDPCLRSAAMSFGSPASPTLFQYRRQGGWGFARLSGSWEISGSPDFSFFLSRKRTIKKIFMQPCIAVSKPSASAFAVA
jgi:hypothetical protein